MIDISSKLSRLLKLKVVIILSILTFCSFLVLFISFNYSSKFLIMLIIIPVLITLLLNFQIIYKIFILSLFYEFGIYYFYLSTLLFPFVALSFLINYSYKLSDIKNPILFYFTFFLISILPSYFVAISHPESYLISYNLLAFISILFITPIVLTGLNDIKSLGVLYLGASSLNAFYLIITSIFSGKREFGFAGIMYVDLVGVGIVISYSSFLFFKKHSVLFGFITILQVLALLFTQTRNAWISSAVIIFLITIYYIIKNKNFKRLNSFSLKRVLFVLSAVLIIVMVSEFIFPNIFTRISNQKVQTTEELAVTMDFGSIATRFFIWEIAYNVFKANPIIGTGFHSFRFVSLEYSKLDPFLYSTFVYNLTPHTTILALLADTGILGFIGFLIFMYLTIRFFKRNLDQSITREQKIISFILFGCQIYIIISMIMTDAWLWGTLHMLWAVILGISVFLRNDIKTTQAISSSSD